jgi:hypothetical protein
MWTTLPLTRHRDTNLSLKREKSKKVIFCRFLTFPQNPVERAFCHKFFRRATNFRQFLLAFYLTAKGFQQLKNSVLSTLFRIFKNFYIPFPHIFKHLWKNCGDFQNLSTNS